MSAAYYAALLASLATPTPTPGLRSDAQAYLNRVQADGGTVYSAAAVNDAFAAAAAWALAPAVTHWSSPLFGYKMAGGLVVKRYCLYGNDAAPQNAGTGWLLQAGAAGKGPQHTVAERTALVSPIMPLGPQEVTLVAITTTSGYEHPNSNTYPFMPVVELTENFNNYSHTFLVGIDYSAGGHFGGANNPLNLPCANAFGAPLNVQTSRTVRIDARIVGDTAAQVRTYLNGAQLIGNYVNGSAADLNVFGGPLPLLPLYLGARGTDNQYTWRGNINDVFFTNAVLPDAAVAYLESRTNLF